MSKGSKDQLEQVAKKCRKMRRQIAFIIIDDEKYLTFSNDEMPQNVVFDKEHVSDNVKYKTREEYSKQKDFSLVGVVIERYFNSFYWYYKRSSHYRSHLY